MTAYYRNFLIILVLTIVGVVIYNVVNLEQKPPAMSYSSFLSGIKNKEIKSVLIKGGEITGSDIYNRPFATFSPDVATVIARLEEQAVEITTAPGKSASGGFTSSSLPLLIIMGAWIVMMFFQKKSGSDFAKNKSFSIPTKALSITFKDVAGVPEAKEELEEIISFLRDSKKFTRLGGRLPKGVLLQGPPGTGKTLLAKAIAGEAGVPFFSISGSDFVEMYVGVGASRVRDLFKQAKKNAPCIIFIDEIDAVGGHRAAKSAAGGQDERQQTLNALLVEMDGFKTGDTVVIVAATNRPDALDPALLRPGRFDRQVNILPPDINGRQEILEVYGRNIVMADKVHLRDIAAATPGFTGADLANLMNESALLAARKNKDAVDLDDIEDAKDKIMMGSERKGLVISMDERRTTAYHEAGHAILARLLPNTDPLHKITIIPRGRAMGMTQQVPLDDRHSYSKEYLTNRIKIMLGGRTAEEIIFNQFTTGASNDLQSATAIATRMICQWGMSDHLGPRAYTGDDQGFLGGATEKLLYSEETAMAIDHEINSLIEECYQEAMIILEGRIDYLHKLAALLLEKETIGPPEIDSVITSNQPYGEE
ncbi:MAG: ATP-dependent zinc metalloprotease FtsH [Proteobacteria bacterium]|nr:ATP-dependent zinc metalloprotease FtsH [Pseudomonadota bacterium]MBU1689080.1 ATP-dependent zinc metalloprotease FtsH [Pseudomonadota bacterium]